MHTIRFKHSVEKSAKPIVQSIQTTAINFFPRLVLLRTLSTTYWNVLLLQSKIKSCTFAILIKNKTKQRVILWPSQSFTVTWDWKVLTLTFLTLYVENAHLIFFLVPKNCQELVWWCGWPEMGDNRRLSSIQYKQVCIYSDFTLG